MPDTTHHERVIARLRAALAASEAQRQALLEATTAHLAANPDPVASPPPTTEEA